MKKFCAFMLVVVFALLQVVGQNHLGKTPLQFDGVPLTSNYEQFFDALSKKGYEPINVNGNDFFYGIYLGEQVLIRPISGPSPAIIVLTGDHFNISQATAKINELRPKLEKIYGGEFYAKEDDCYSMNLKNGRIMIGYVKLNDIYVVMMVFVDEEPAVAIPDDSISIRNFR